MALPAGTIGTAIGFHYREDEINDTPGEITLAGNAWGTSTAGITAGDDTTTAFFAEVDVPIFRDAPFAKSLALNASARYTDVDSYGSDTTHKVGVNWAINDSVRFRVNQGTSFRTPALFELFLADQTSSLRQTAIDPCIRWGAELDAGNISQRTADNCAADGLASDFAGAAISATIITGGGAGILEAETSESTTAGIIWQPGFADLSISLDYFDIEVKDEVDKIGAAQIVQGCYGSEFFPNEPLCNLFERTPAGQPTPPNLIDNVRDSFINIATQTNRGWDLAAVYRTGLWGGELTLDTQHTFQLEDKVALFADNVRDENGELGNPEWVGRFNATYDRGDWSYFWGANIIGDASNVDSFGGNTATYRGETVRVVLDTDEVVYHSFSLSRDFGEGLIARLGVANAFDEEPPRLTTLNLGEVDTEGNSAFYSQYDWRGRRFFLNISKTFN